ALYNTIGNFSASTEALAQARTIALDNFSESSLPYSEYLKNEAQYYLAIGDYAKATGAMQLAASLQRKLLPAKSVALAATLTELAYLSSFEQTNIKQAATIYEEATDIVREILGENIPMYADLLKKKGIFFSITRQYAQSDALLLQSLSYWNKLLGTSNVNAAEIYVILGNNAYAQNAYTKAGADYSRSYEIYKSKFSEAHPGATLSAGKLARSLLMQQKFSEALHLMEKTIPLHLSNKNRFFAAMSFSEKSKFWNLIKDEFDFYNFLVVKDLKNNPQRIGSIYNNTLATKALLLSNTLKIKRSIMSSGDSSLISKYNEWLHLKELLLYAYSLNKEQLQEQHMSLSALEGQVESLEKVISKRSSLFSEQEKVQKYTWKDIVAVLNDNEYVLEVLRVRKFDKYFVDSSQYVAMILNAHTLSMPEYVVIDHGKELDTKYISYYRNAIKFNLQDKHTYQKFWKPIKEKIPNGMLVYLSPDGSYCQVNIETAYNGSDYAIEENQFIYLTNSVDLASKQVHANLRKHMTSGERIVLCGDPEFYSSTTNAGIVASLEGTQQEVREIKKIVSSRYKDTDILVLTDKHVLEDTIKNIRSPLVFHIATHGYYKESMPESEGQFKSNPLLNSGLLLGYSGDLLESKDSYVNHRSGILTAYEVSNMDFDRTKLVVLSACETGKGEVQAGEGVMGLVRAFTIAGGKAIINSLFKINDQTTVEFMALFYGQYMLHMDERQAFIYAKKEMKKRYPQPLSWGAFILYEAGH
ncbi:MAG TPA: CHAT domain-containing tetratricopeptide repeat protein, partial [Cytophagales bacterium]|nr:CHAT domain-containing tetratricopeptide repeat protein [Cytophagales bacterium]